MIPNVQKIVFRTLCTLWIYDIILVASTYISYADSYQIWKMAISIVFNVFHHAPYH